MTEDEFLDDQKTWFDPKNEANNTFFWESEEWMKDVMKRSEQAVIYVFCISSGVTDNAQLLVYVRLFHQDKK